MVIPKGDHVLGVPGGGAVGAAHAVKEWYRGRLLIIQSQLSGVQPLGVQGRPKCTWRLTVTPKPSCSILGVNSRHMGCGACDLAIVPNSAGRMLQGGCLPARANSPARGGAVIRGSSELGREPVREKGHDHHWRCSGCGRLIVR